MEPIGIIQGITSEGNIIVKCENLPNIGNAVYDSTEHRVGIVRRVFGPVDSPCATIETEDERRSCRQPGKKLYCKVRRSNNGKKQGRNRRN